MTTRQQYEAALSMVELCSIACNHPKKAPSDSYEADLLDGYTEADYRDDAELVRIYEESLPDWVRNRLVTAKASRVAALKSARGLGT